MHLRPVPVPALAAAFCALTLSLAVPRAATGAWPGSPYDATPLALAAGHQVYPDAASDGAGGAIVVWRDGRNDGADVYAQRISATGETLWTTDGVPVCTATGEQSEPRIAPDGSGGAVIAWQDGRNAPGDDADIYVQRLNASGVPQWTANGVVACSATSWQAGVELASDATGGAIVVWTDARNGATTDIFIQRLNALGAPRWTVNGVQLRAAANDADSPKIVPDGAGGAMTVWTDYRSGTGQLYAQRVNSTGVPQWGANGTSVNAVDYASGHVATSDGAGGMLLAWTSLSADWNVFAQRVSPSGVMQWGFGGALVSGGTGDQHAPRIVPDGSGGAIVAFEDARTGVWQIGVQRVSAGGGELWGLDGVALTNQPGGSVAAPRLASDGTGGAIVAWLDWRASQYHSIFAQRVSGSGAPLWTAEGVLVCAAPGDRSSPAMVADDSGGAILAWQDTRNSPVHYDLYAQRVERHGQLGQPAPAIAGVTDVPNDQGGFVRVAWDASDLDVEPDYGIAEYRLYRSVPVPGPAARRPVTTDSDVAATGSAILLLASGGGGTYWEFVTSQEAQAFAGYSVVAATPADSVAGSNPRTLFMVDARGGSSSSSPHWYSAPDSGYSVDNLAPAPPVQFAGSYAAGTSHLSWQPSPESDFATYHLHRGTTAAFVPDGTNLISAQPDTGYVDAAGSAYYYKLAAVDVHGNVSDHAAWAPLAIVGVPGGLGAGIAFAPPAPNPAARSATLSFVLPRAAHVRLSVVDVAGREVRVLADRPLAEGPHALPWDLRDNRGRAASAGVYFMRLEADGRTLVRRLAVMR